MHTKLAKQALALPASCFKQITCGTYTKREACSRGRTVRGCQSQDVVFPRVYTLEEVIIICFFDEATNVLVVNGM